MNILMWKENKHLLLPDYKPSISPRLIDSDLHFRHDPNCIWDTIMILLGQGLEPESPVQKASMLTTTPTVPTVVIYQLRCLYCTNVHYIHLNVTLSLCICWLHCVNSFMSCMHLFMLTGLRSIYHPEIFFLYTLLIIDYFPTLHTGDLLVEILEQDKLVST